MKSIYEFFRNLIAAEQPMRESFNVVDPLAVGDQVRSITLAVAPPSDAGPSTDVSLYWTESEEKVFEKKFDNEEEAIQAANLLKQDLQHAAELTKQNNLDGARQVISVLLQQSETNSDKIVNPSQKPMTTTMASQDKVANEYKQFEFWLRKNIEMLQGKNFIEIKRLALQNGFSEEIVDDVLNSLVQPLQLENSKTMKLNKEAKAQVKNVFQTITFDSPEELMQYQEQMKSLQPTQTPGTELPGGETPIGDMGNEEELGEPSMSYEDVEKEKAEQEKNMNKRIEEEVKDQVESALKQKIATMFNKKDEELVKALRGVGRTWEEIKDYMIKELKYDKDGVAAFLDQFKNPDEREPEPELMEPTDEPKMEEGPKPPKETVSPETHDQLVKEVDNLDEIPKKEMQEIAQKDGEISKKASPFDEVEDPLEDKPEPDLKNPMGDEDADGLFPSPKEPEGREPQQLAPQPQEMTFEPGDDVYVLSNPDTGEGAFHGKYVNDQNSRHGLMAIVFDDDGMEHAVPKNLLTDQSGYAAAASKTEKLKKKAEQEAALKFARESASIELKKMLAEIQALEKRASEEVAEQIEPGDYVDFGPYGKLYVNKVEMGDRSRVTDSEEDRSNPNAAGWYIDLNLAQRIIEKANPEDEDEDLEASSNGPSDEDVQQKAWEMFKEHWNALSSEQQDQVYKALGVTASQKKKASTYTALNEIADRGEEITDPEMVEGLSPEDLMQLIKHPEAFHLRPHEVANIQEALNQMTSEASQKEAAPKAVPVQDPSPKVEDQPVEFKHYERAPKETDREKAVIAPPQVVEMVNRLQSLNKHLATIDTEAKNLRAQAEEAIKTVEEQGGKQQALAEKVQILDQLYPWIEKAGGLIRVNEEYLKSVTSEKDLMKTPNAKEILAEVMKKMPAINALVEKITKKFTVFVKRIRSKELIHFSSKKLSSVDIEAISDEELAQSLQQDLAMLVDELQQGLPTQE